MKHVFPILRSPTNPFAVAEGEDVNIFLVFEGDDDVDVFGSSFARLRKSSTDMQPERLDPFAVDAIISRME